MPKFNVSCSVLINASIDDVYSVVRGFKSWPRWSPWLICEPGCALDYPVDGKSYSWRGKSSGAGKWRSWGRRLELRSIIGELLNKNKFRTPRREIALLGHIEPFGFFVRY